MLITTAESASKMSFLISNGIFTGAAIYIDLVTKHARVQLPIEYDLQEWNEEFDRAKILQSLLTVVASASGVAAYYCSKQSDATRPWWLVAAALQGFVFPFTMLCIMPTNHELKALLQQNRQENANSGEDRAKSLLRKWHKLHAVRIVASLAAMGVATWLVTKK